MGLIGETDSYTGKSEIGGVFPAWVKMSFLASLHLPLPRSGGCWAQELAPTGSDGLLFAVPTCLSVRVNGVYSPDLGKKVQVQFCH